MKQRRSAKLWSAYHLSQSPWSVDAATLMRHSAEQRTVSAQTVSSSVSLAGLMRSIRLASSVERPRTFESLSKGLFLATHGNRK